MNPFKIISSRAVYENPWIALVEHQIQTPRGTPGVYGVVQFKNRAVGVVPYEDGHIWLVGQYRLPLESYSWEIPEGGSPVGEDLLMTAKRELKEETGFTAQSFRSILKMHLSNSVSDEYAEVFLAEGLKLGDAEPEETEILSLRKVTLEAAYTMLGEGEITDAISVATILKLKLMLHDGTLKK